MDIYLASPRGFCAGVVRAVDIVERALQIYGPPIYVKHQIVHNSTVVRDLDNKGAITVENVADVPPNSKVIFSAHGSPPSDYEIAEKLNLTVLDATCPLVIKVHNEARKYTRQKQRVILIGHRGHQEVIGTQGYADVYLIDEREDFDFPNWDADDRITVLTQTTLSVDDTARTVEKLRERFNNLEVRNDICYATSNRQHAVKQLLKTVEVLFIIGSEQSSNCNRLLELATQQNIPGYLVNSPDDVKSEMYANCSKVGLSSGASTPEKTVQAVIKRLAPDNVFDVGEVSENIVFTMPKELRNGSPNSIN